jgi:hypothetical protein
MKKILSALLVGLVLSVTACGQQEEVIGAKTTKRQTEVTFKDIEDSREQARGNSEYNAQLYRAENPRLDGFKIVAKTDSTIDNSCPQGDGWASVNFMKVTGQVIEKVSAKCSTVSSALGCYRDEDFTKKSFAVEDGKCQPLQKVPYPLPKVGK